MAISSFNGTGNNGGVSSLEQDLALHNLAFLKY
jgi:hypothetical protein